MMDLRGAGVPPPNNLLMSHASEPVLMTGRYGVHKAFYNE